MSEEIQQTLVVTRNGSLDQEYYAVERSEQVREALVAFGHEVVTKMLQAPVVIGKGTVWLFTHEHETAV